MELNTLKEAFKISYRNKKKYDIKTSASTDGSDELDLETLNSEYIKEITNKKTKRKFFIKEKYKDLFSDGEHPFDDFDYVDQYIRGFIEYTSYMFLKHLKKYAPEINIPNKIKLSYDHGNGRSSYQTMSSSFKNTKQPYMTKPSVYRNLIIDTYLFLVLIGHVDFHSGNLIVRNRNEYYMIDPEICLQDYRMAAFDGGRDTLEFMMEPYFKYKKEFPEIKRQYEVIKQMNVEQEFSPIIDKCIDIAVKAMIQDGEITSKQVNEKKAHLITDIKTKILSNLKKNKKFIMLKFDKYANAPEPLKSKSLFSRK